MSLKITTLIENSPGEHLALKHEHGVAFYIEKDGHKLLFDTGQSGAFLENAEQLRVDLSDLEYVFISHGHYDHSGGFRELAKTAEGFTLVVGRGFFKEKYGYKNNSYEYLGSNFDEDFPAGHGVRLEFADAPHREVLPGVHVITDFPRIHEDEKVNPRFKVLENGKYVPDTFDDEIMLALDTPRGLVVLLGCSHPGVKNMLDRVQELVGGPIYAVLGGTHMVESSEASIDRTIAYFKDKGVEVIGVSHCTGQAAMDGFKVFGDKYFHNRTGSSLFVE